MFNSIDSKLINFFQWMIRQFELYTQIQRKNIVNFAITIVKLLFAMFVLLSLFFIFFQKNFFDSVIYLALTLMVISVYYPSFKKTLALSNRNYPPGILPEEIVSRRADRISGCILAVPLNCIPLSLLMAISERSSEVDVVELGQWTAFGLLYNCVLLVEYLLCTTSLPPGEKQRKEEEREMKYLTP